MRTLAERLSDCWCGLTAILESGSSVSWDSLTSNWVILTRALLAGFYPLTPQDVSFCGDQIRGCYENASKSFYKHLVDNSKFSSSDQVVDALTHCTGTKDIAIGQGKSTPYEIRKDLIAKCDVYKAYSEWSMSSLDTTLLVLVGNAGEEKNFLN